MNNIRKEYYEYYTYKEYPNRDVLSCKIAHVPVMSATLRKRKPIEFRLVATTKVSARRASAIISDIVECNIFDFFVTLTFGTQERLNDTSVKCDWDNFRREFRRLYPTAYYIAVPEYHKTGGLHIHMCIGGVGADELKLTDSGYVCCSWAKKTYINKKAFELHKKEHILKASDGMPIYNVGAWSLGFSTATKIQSQKAVQKYISKYIRKGGVDPRFCDAKRYWCSKNLIRPNMLKFAYNYYKNSKIEFCLDKLPISYADIINCYYVFDMSKNYLKEHSRI